MADNVEITAGSGTTISTDDIAGVQVQRVKIQHGDDGTALDVNNATPLPIQGFVDANLASDSVGLALAVSQTDGNQKTQILDSGGNVIGATSNALDVNIKSGASAAFFIPFDHDYFAYTNTNSTTDTYEYNTGGSGGTLVATVTIVYTDTTKETISTVTRT